MRNLASETPVAQSFGRIQLATVVSGSLVWQELLRLVSIRDRRAFARAASK
jgi:hypothetical protein